MKKLLMHPAYFEGVAEEEVEQYQPMARGEDSGREVLNEEPTGLRNSIRAKLKGALSRSFLSGIGVGVVAVSLLWLPMRAKAPASTDLVLPPVLSTPVAVADHAPDLTKLESDMELMKKIVSGLVETVHSLSRSREVSAMTPEPMETFPYPVKVSAGKAHLRKEADRLAPSLLEVTKDTTLMAFAGTDKWLKVSTPRGEDAWISRSVVVAQKG